MYVCISLHRESVGTTRIIHNNFKIQRSNILECYPLYFSEYPLRLRTGFSVDFYLRFAYYVTVSPKDLPNAPLELYRAFACGDFNQY